MSASIQEEDASSNEVHEILSINDDGDDEDKNPGSELVSAGEREIEPTAGGSAPINPKRKKSVLWEHVKKTISDGSILLECNHCSKSWSLDEAKWIDQGKPTTNISKHVKDAHPQKWNGNSAIGPMDLFLKENEIVTNVTDSIIKKAIEDYFISECIPFETIESPSFIWLLKVCLNYKGSSFSIPKADALRNAILKRIELMKKDLQLSLKNYKSKFNVVIDAWTSENYHSFLAISLNFIDENWNLAEELIEFKDTTDHTGENMANVVIAALKFYGILPQIGAITSDNVGANDSMCNIIAEKIQEEFQWDPDENRIRCLPHIINLAVKAFLKKFDNASYEEFELDNVGGVGDVNHENSNIRLLISKLRFIVKKLRSSPQQRESFKKHCDAAEIKFLMVILDVCTRWNSTFYMVERALQLKAAINAWIDRNPVIGKTPMKRFKLKVQEWKHLEEIEEHLKFFEEATRSMSASLYPTLNLVVPIFIELFTHIEDVLSKEHVSTDLKFALNEAHGVLSKYYALLDKSPLYSIAVILDPRFKRVYLEKKGFEEMYPGYLDETISHLRKLMKNYEDATKDRADNDLEIIENITQAQRSNGLFSNMFEHHQDGKENQLDELDRYLLRQCEPQKVDPLQYWKYNSEEFPILSLVARNILSIPGSAVSVERVFNFGRDTIGLRRQRLKAETISALMFGFCYSRKRKQL